MASLGLSRDAGDSVGGNGPTCQTSRRSLAPCAEHDVGTRTGKDLVTVEPSTLLSQATIAHKAIQTWSYAARLW